MNRKYKRIIDIHGVPRSGTSWLAQILDSSEIVRLKFQPLFSDSFKDRITLKSSKIDIENYYDQIYLTQDDYLDRTLQKKNGIYPIFRIKDELPEILCSKNVTHHYLIPYLLNLLTNYHVIGIIRNPCAVLASFKNYPSDFKTEWNFSEEWEFSPKRGGFRPENYFGFQKWKEFAKLLLIYKSLYPNKVYIIKYEKLVLNTKIEIEKMFGFFKIPLSNQTLDFINDSTSIEVNDSLSVFKKNKELGSWKSKLDEEIIAKIYRELSNSEFEQFI